MRARRRARALTPCPSKRVATTTPSATTSAQLTKWISASTQRHPRAPCSKRSQRAATRIASAGKLVSM
jgi:hypothetical protein